MKMKLYRININDLDDPQQNKGLLESVGVKRREKILRYYKSEDRKRSLGAGIIIEQILKENGLSEDHLKYSENGKPVADNLFFNVSHAGDYVVGVSSDCDVGCDIEKIMDAPIEIAEHYFNQSEIEYIKSESDKNKAFFTLWTLKESYMKMTGMGMSLPLDSFEIIKTEKEFVLGRSQEKHGFFKTIEFDEHIFSVCSEKENIEDLMQFCENCTTDVKKITLKL